jgi:hypothetical protein
MIDRYHSVVRGMQSALQLWEVDEAFDTIPIPIPVTMVIAKVVDRQP